MSHDSHRIAESLIKLKTEHPLIQCITNFVVMPFNANALLAIGATPVMAHAQEELEDIAHIAKALVINIGTLDHHWIASMTDAMNKAKARHIPVVLDPVGVGASRFRTQTALKLIEANAPKVIRGNASEIIALSGETLESSKGVDSVHSSNSAVEAGKILAKRYGCTIVISGAQDFIIQEERVACLENGVPMMTQVTGMGCTATALIGAFLAVESNPFQAALCAMASMGIAGEVAYGHAKGPGTFQVEFLDALHQLDEILIKHYLRLSEVS
ncbi:MAG: hydroxyethylthiazole kinase [Gammaproteobacteria bacterium]|nr:hydroxyethylthiazole kinase [Gammaproteobacteria bacterium]